VRLARVAVLAALCLGAVAVGGCGEDDGGATVGAGTASTPDPTVNPTPRPQSGDVAAAALGDSIVAGSPLYDPDPAVQKRIGARLDPRSQFEHWYVAAHTRYTLRNCGVFGERTDQIAQRLEGCAKGARVLIVQGGINDIAQDRPVQDAADDLRSMYAAGKRLGLKVYGAEVLPWNNGPPAAAAQITQLNRLIHAAADAEGVPVFPWHRALEDPAAPGRMRADLTDDGDHPSVAGYKRLAGAMRLP
jgi:lysophospholipase L1-like esterase